MEITDLFNPENIQFVFDQVVNHGASSTLSVIGFLLAIVTILLVWKAIRAKPGEFSAPWQFFLMISLIGSILLPVGGQALALLDLSAGEWDLNLM